jgi:hypothetical protein
MPAEFIDAGTNPTGHSSSGCSPEPEQCQLQLLLVLPTTAIVMLAPDMVMTVDDFTTESQLIMFLFLRTQTEFKTCHCIAFAPVYSLKWCFQPKLLTVISHHR